MHFPPSVSAAAQEIGCVSSTIVTHANTGSELRGSFVKHISFEGFYSFHTHYKSSKLFLFGNIRKYFIRTKKI